MELNTVMGKAFEETSAKFKSYVMPTYSPQMMFVRGENARLWDDDGNEYLDFAAGIAVCSLGHCNPRVTAAIAEQAGRRIASKLSNIFANSSATTRRMRSALSYTFT